jgi:hypothetical protein
LLWITRAGKNKEMGSGMEIAYKALTGTCTLLLDANGICRSVLAATSSQRGGPARIPASAERCIGAQFVATLDLRDPTGLTHMPEVGAPMLFARIEIDGRITLVRSAPLISFETVTQVDSGVRERPELNLGLDDEEKTTPIEIDELTIPRRQSYGPHAQTAPYAWTPERTSYPPRDAYAPSDPRQASYPPPRTSMKVPITRGFELPRVTIPPPPRAHTPQSGVRSGFPAAPPISPVRRPGVAGVPAPFYEGVPTLPFRRAAR